MSYKPGGSNTQHEKLSSEGVILIHKDDPEAKKYRYHCQLCSIKMKKMVLVNIHCSGNWHTKMKRKYLEMQKTKDIEGKDKQPGPGLHGPKISQPKKTHANDTPEERTWLDVTFGEGIITIRKNNESDTCYYCELCDKYEPSKFSLARHTYAFQHSRLEKRGKRSTIINDTPVVRASLDEIYGKGIISIRPLAMNPNSIVYFCQICTENIATGKMLYSHSQGRTHKENLRKMDPKIGDRKGSEEEDPNQNRKIHDESSSEIQANNEEDKTARHQSSTGKVNEWTDSKQHGQKSHKRWKPADVNLPPIHRSREHRFPGSKTRHQYSPSYCTSSTTAASSAVPYNLYSSSNYDHHSDNLPFDHHSDNLPFDHYSDNNNLDHQQHTNSSLLPLPLTLSKPQYEHAKVCSIKSSFIDQVECCRLNEEDVGEATGLVMKLITAVEDYFTHNPQLKNARQAKRTLGEAGTQFERLKLLLEEEVSKKKKKK
ncbi:hypothetical protein Pmani_009877 [Petrolisthes manimaculis]|uniref:Matrin-type domain-containing protein n=1 Tax=Petrolisthes manimaculis TaxID=1843537 RepID=A0AAE1Q365_9EUCA|nr:hypothetical protein Pmani_009877 [Petrolisthes manimaculis]